MVKAASQPCQPVRFSEMQLNWLIYVNTGSRAVLPNLGLKQQVYRGSFGRLHIAKLRALLETQTRQTEALFARHIVLRIMMHLTESKQLWFSYCVPALWDYEVSCQSAGVDGVMTGNICGETAEQSTCVLIMASSTCVVLVLTHDLRNICMSYSEFGVVLCRTVHSMFQRRCRNYSDLFLKLYCSCCTCNANMFVSSGYSVDVCDIRVSQRITLYLWC